MLKFEDGLTTIYVNGELFNFYCKRLLLNIDLNEIHEYDQIDSIDEAIEIIRNRQVLEDDIGVIPEEDEFWGHCSNLHYWYLNKYDTRTLHRNLAFPLLKALSKAGDKLAKKVFNEEIAKRFSSGHLPVMLYLLSLGYISYLETEEIEVLVENTNFSKFTDKELSKLLYCIENINKKPKLGILIKKILNEIESTSLIHRNYIDFDSHNYDRNYVCPVLISKNEKNYIVGDNYGNVIVRKIFSGELIKCIRVFNRSIKRISLSHDENFLSVISVSESIAIVDMNREVVIKVFDDIKRQIYFAIFSKDDKTLIGVCERRIYLWNFSSFELINKVITSDKHICSVLFAPNYKAIITCTNKRNNGSLLKLWSLPSLNLVSKIELFDINVEKILSTKDCKHIYCLTDVNELWSMDLTNTDSFKRDFTFHKKYPIKDFIISETRNQFFLITQKLKEDSESLIYIFDLEFKDYYQKIRWYNDDIPMEPFSITVSNYSNFILCCSEESFVKIWFSLETLQEILND